MGRTAKVDKRLYNSKSVSDGNDRKAKWRGWVGEVRFELTVLRRHRAKCQEANK